MKPIPKWKPLVAAISILLIPLILWLLK